MRESKIGLGVNTTSQNDMFEKVIQLAARLILLVLVVTVIGVVPVHAAGPFTVNTTTDTHDASINGSCSDAGGNCSLRAAIEEANASGAPTTINVPAGIYTLSLGELQVGVNSGSTITIAGAGAGGTVIQQGAAGCSGSKGERVFFLDPGYVGNVAVTISGVTISNGAAQGWGGGAILGGGPGDSLNLSNSVISNNCTNANNGAGISWGSEGALTISNTTFNGNSAGNQWGGAIFYSIDSTNSLTITNSTFTGNSAAGQAGSAGGAIYIQDFGAVTHPNVSINGSTFTNNTATGASGIGGAIFMSGGTLNLGTTAVNRFVGNTAAGVPVSGAIGITGGTVNGANNWWGCNTGPGGTGCDKVNATGGTLTTSPYVVLQSSASPSTINPGQLSTISASVARNSSGGAVTPGALAGLTVNWTNPVNGSFSPSSSTVQSGGAAASTFTHDGLSCTTASGTANLDNAQSTANITVTCPPNLSINDVSLSEGNSGTTSYTFTVSLSAPAGAGGVTFDIATADGTATAPSAYSSKSLTGQTIPAGSSTYSFTVQVNGDTIPEADETFFVNVTNVTGATVTDGQGQGTIINDDVTKIHDVQGNGASTPIPGVKVIAEGVVTANFQGTNKLRGFFLQEEDADADADPNTSEGIFVYCNTCPTPVAEGQRVRATGTVSEYNGLTEITASTADSVVVSDAGNHLAEVTPTPIDLPVAGDVNSFYEGREGMLVTFVAPLTVADISQLSRIGQIGLFSGGRPQQFTEGALPNVAGYTAHLDNLSRRRVILDDDNNSQEWYLTSLDGLQFVYYPRANGGFSIGTQGTDFFRSGDTVNGLTGVLHWSFPGFGPSEWRIRPTTAHPVMFTVANPRPATPPSVGGAVKVATVSFSNYFTTIDTTASSSTGTCGPSGTLECRGADSVAELNRQREMDSIVICSLNADIYALLDLENTTPSDTITDLLGAVNARCGGAHPFAFVNTGGTLGVDAVRVQQIYRTGIVSPIGSPLVDLDPIHTRPPTAQTFDVVDAANPAFGKRFTVIANDFRSRGCDAGAIGADADAGDGQGCYVDRRTQQASRLLTWANSTVLPAAGDPNLLLLGDFSSYAQETPVTTVTGSGYTDLENFFLGASGYSLVYGGELGHLDHAFASTSLVPQVTGSAPWHINADESALFDYNDEVLDSPGEVAFEVKPDGSALVPPRTVFQPATPLRASDRDPILVGLFPVADLSITNTDGVTTATPGGSTTYTITASNAGPSNAPGSTVADTFPAILTCTWSCVGAGGGTCTASGSGNINDTVNLPSGGSVTYTASCTISASASGTLSNTATVAAPGGVTDPSPGNNSATDTDTLAPQADLSITNTDGVTTATTGGSTTYTITASNAGPSNAPGSTVADTFPAALTCTWTCVGAGGGTCTASGSGNINDTVNLPGGGSVTYTASCTISASGTLSNTATVAAPAGVTDPTPGNNSGSDTTFVCSPAITVTTNADSGPGSLRLAIAEICAGGGIGFDPALSGQTVTLTSGQLAIDKSMTIAGLTTSPGVSVSGNNAVRVFSVSAGTVTINNLTIQNGRNVPVIPGNIGGAGLFVATGAAVALNSCAVLNNATNPAPTVGGGIVVNTGASLTMNNCTVSGNSSSFDAGGILNLGTLAINNGTIVGNSTPGAGGGLETVTSTVTLRNTILAGNSGSMGADCYTPGGGIQSAGYNLIGSTANCTVNSGTGDVTGIGYASLLLGTLQNNGGPTSTYALLAGSPAINAIPGCNGAPATDQRGISRPQGGACEIGAYEASVPATPTATAGSAITAAGFTANWSAVDGASGYYLDVANDSGFTGLISGYNSKDVGNIISAAVSGLAPGTTYYYRVQSYNGAGSSAESNAISVVTRSGRVSSVIVDPSVPARLYCTVDGGGVFASMDGGGTWSATGGQPASNRLQAIILKPGAPATLYAASYGNGVYVTQDSGAGWSICANGGLTGSALNVMALASDATGRLYAGTEGGIFTSTDCATWNAINNGLTIDAGTPPVAIAIDPAAPATLYAGLDGAGVYKSSDSGANWTAATTQPTNLRVKALVLKPGDSTKQFAATYGGGVFMSSNSGVTWNACATQPANLNTLSLTIDAGGRLYAGSEAGVFVSSDGCATWTMINSGLP